MTDNATSVEADVLFIELVIRHMPSLDIGPPTTRANSLHYCMTLLLFLLQCSSLDSVQSSLKFSVKSPSSSGSALRLSGRSRSV